MVKDYLQEDTIAAISTPPGEGGIGIVRMSGSRALEIALKIFACRGGSLQPRMLTYGRVTDPETHETVDEAMAVYLPAPKTYTREDVVEFDCHGGRIPLAGTLELCIREGARLAEPGEFTKRAFLNGRIDLVQAEAVMDLIGAKTEAAGAAALDRLRGRFSETLDRIRARLTDVLVDLDVDIDYPDEDIEELNRGRLIDGLKDVKADVDRLLASADAGRIISSGVPTAIIGRPNVGKSSLMNALLRESRSIVTDIPGTTRDTIEESANIKGIEFRLTDTAGIRETDDVIEKMGIDRSLSSKENADLTVLVIDGSQPVDREDEELASSLDPSRSLILFNKSDRDLIVTEEQMRSISGKVPFLITSMSDRASVDEVENAMYEIVMGSTEHTGPLLRKEGSFVTNVRHKTMLRNASDSLAEALSAAEGGEPPEIIEISVREAYEQIGLITGASVQDDIIDEIFSRFCLGK